MPALSPVPIHYPAVPAVSLAICHASSATKQVIECDRVAGEGTLSNRSVFFPSQRDLALVDAGTLGGGPIRPSFIEESGFTGFVAACVVQFLSVFWQEHTQKKLLRKSLYREMVTIFGYDFWRKENLS